MGEIGDCQHHWVIDPANGPESHGVCRKCGLERAFINHVPSAGWRARGANDYQMLREGVTIQDIGLADADTMARLRRAYLEAGRGEWRR